MSGLLWGIVIWLAVQVPETEPAQGLDRVFADYLAIAAALATDNLNGAVTAAAKLVDALAQVDQSRLAPLTRNAWQIQHPRLLVSSRKAAAAPDLSSLRLAFKSLSESAVTLALIEAPADIQRMRCPMAFDQSGADWLQKGTEIRNPYFGNEMPNCGFMIRMRRVIELKRD